MRTEGDPGHYVCDKCGAQKPIYAADYLLIIDQTVFSEDGKITSGNYRLCSYRCLWEWAIKRSEPRPKKPRLEEFKQ